MGKYTRIKYRIYKDVCVRVEKVEVINVVNIKKKFLKGKVGVECKDCGEKDFLLKELEKAGVVFFNGDKPTTYNHKYNFYGYQINDKGYLVGMDYSKEIVKFKDIIKTKKKIKSSFFTDQIAVNCTSENQARKFLKSLDKMGYKFGVDPDTHSDHYIFKHNTCFALWSESIYATQHKEWYEKEGYKIIQYKDILEVSHV